MSIVEKTLAYLQVLAIYPKPGVSIVEDLEPAVRTINSPCRNLLWGRANVVEESDTSSDTTAGSDTDGGMVCPLPLMWIDVLLLIDQAKTRALRIILIHGNDNHNGNIHRDTVVSIFGSQFFSGMLKAKNVRRPCSNLPHGTPEILRSSNKR